jgi:hypothetical protein
MWKKDENNFFLNKKKKKSGRARFSGTGGDDHQFFLCGLMLLYHLAGHQIEGVLAYFTHLKRQKRIGDDVRDFKYVFTKKIKL